MSSNRATSVDHPGAEDGHILDSLSPEDGLAALVGIDVRGADNNSALAEPDADTGLELDGTRDVTSHAELKGAATL